MIKKFLSLYIMESTRELHLSFLVLTRILTFFLKKKKKEKKKLSIKRHLSFD